MVCASRTLVLACFATLLLACAAAPKSGSQPIAGWSSVTVGVKDLDVALDLWVDTFGFDLADRRTGPDTELARLWGLVPDDIAEQALVRTGNSHFGMIHFVEFNAPGLPVRQGAQVFDLVPKNLDVYVDDLPLRFVELKDAKRTFRTDNYSEVTAPDGTTFREIHMPSHDDINVVLLEVLGKPLPFSPRGYAGVGPLIFIVPDASTEKSFFENVMQLDKLNDNLLKGPEIERMIGLPPGAGLDVSIWGRVGNNFGDIEIIEYQGVRGRDLYPHTRPKSLGILHISYVVPDAAQLLYRLRAAGIEASHHGRIDSLTGEGVVSSFNTPAGLRIEVYEHPTTTH